MSWTAMKFRLQVLELLLQRLGRRAGDEQLALVAADLAADLFLLGREVVALVLEELGRQRGLGAGRRPGVGRFGRRRRSGRRGARDSFGVPPAGACGTRHSSMPFGWRARTRVACHSSISSCDAGSARVAGHSSGVAAPVARLRGVPRELAAAARITHRSVPHASAGRGARCAPALRGRTRRRCEAV